MAVQQSEQRRTDRDGLAWRVTKGSIGFITLALLALLLIVDISLALLGRLNSQLQLITLAFPIKMLVSLGLLAWLVLGGIAAARMRGWLTGRRAAQVYIEQGGKIANGSQDEAH